MMMSAFPVLMRPFAESQRGWDEDGLVLKRFGDGASFSVGGPSVHPSRFCEVQECIVSSFDVPAGER